MLKVGDEAPELELPDDAGRTVRLADHRGEWVVLFFYPADHTPGCTAEACEFRDVHKELRDLGAVVYGVSRDDVKSHASFRKKHKLPYALLSDEEGKALKAWEAVGLFTHPKRITYVVDPDGVIADIYESQIRAKQHPQRALDVLKAAMEEPAV